jgi:hypothetical protein
MLKFQKHTSNKGIGALAFMLLAELFIVLSVIIFLTFFKYHIELYVSDQYNWNRYQEIPMSFVTATLGERSLAAETNKVFHGFLSVDDYKDETKEFPKLFSGCYVFDVTDGNKKIEWEDKSTSCVTNEYLYDIKYPYPLSFNPDSLLGNMTMTIFPFKSETTQWPRGEIKKG